MEPALLDTWKSQYLDSLALGQICPPEDKNPQLPLLRLLHHLPVKVSKYGECAHALSGNIEDHNVHKRTPHSQATERGFLNLAKVATTNLDAK